jgi:predicted DsbA family dithiol-disulfide isomerase
LSMEQFRKDMKSKEVQDAILNDIASARRYGVTSTPTYFLFVGEKGQMIQGHLNLAAEMQKVMEGD